MPVIVILLLSAILYLGTGTFVFAEAPTIDPANDPDHFGPADQVLFWKPEQQVSGYRNVSRIFPTREIEAGPFAHPWPYSSVDFSGLEIEFDGETLDIDEYVLRNNVAGLLVIKDDYIVLERYALGNTEDTLWVSFSVTKSVVSMLVGAAIKDGYIESVDEYVVDYLPRLRGSSYDSVTIRNVLQMASGIGWNEDYSDRESDVNTHPWQDIVSLFKFMGNKERISNPGETFTYNSGETYLVGALLRAAIGNNLSTYLSEKIWKPFGMASDANWLLAFPGGGETGGCCISATLRDYGRIGVFALNKGQLADGTEVLPKDWMDESTSPSSANAEYGYLWWLNPDGAYEAEGVFGQIIYIHPKQNLIIAKQSAWSTAWNDRNYGFDSALFKAVALKLDAVEKSR